jgi:hypothetical protein
VNCEPEENIMIPLADGDLFANIVESGDGDIDEIRSIKPLPQSIP